MSLSRPIRQRKLRKRVLLFPTQSCAFLPFLPNGLEALVPLAFSMFPPSTVIRRTDLSLLLRRLSLSASFLRHPYFLEHALALARVGNALASDGERLIPRTPYCAFLSFAPSSSEALVALACSWGLSLRTTFSAPLQSDPCCLFPHFRPLPISTHLPSLSCIQSAMVWRSQLSATPP
jgi:hypothetical protein